MLVLVGGKGEEKGVGTGEADREKEASVRKIRGVFEVEDAREARESRLARNRERLFMVEIYETVILLGSAHELMVGDPRPRARVRLKHN